MSYTKQGLCPMNSPKMRPIEATRLELGSMRLDGQVVPVVEPPELRGQDHLPAERPGGRWPPRRHRLPRRPGHLAVPRRLRLAGRQSGGAGDGQGREPLPEAWRFLELEIDVIQIGGSSKYGLGAHIVISRCFRLRPDFFHHAPVLLNHHSPSEPVPLN